MYPFNLISRHMPRWVVFIMELMMVAAAFSGSWFLVLVLFPAHQLPLPGLPHIAAYMLLSAAAIRLFKTYAGVIRHSGIEDVQKVCAFTTVQSCFLLSCVFYFQNAYQAFLIMLVSNFCLLTTSMICFRLIARYLFHVGKKGTKASRRVLIVGAGQLGMMTKNTIELDKWSGKEIVGFIDNNPSKVGKLLNGVPIFSLREAGRKFFDISLVDEVILAIRDTDPEMKNYLYEQCTNKNILITEVPPLQQWMNGGFKVNQLQQLSIESLLERKEICIGNERSVRVYGDACILVTGAAGSIGSEICRQLLQFAPAKLVVLDHGESQLHDLMIELKSLCENVDLQMEVASVRDKIRVEQVFRKHRFQYVFHAAAYKHVPLMEQFPSESVLTNVMGTKNLADAAVNTGVKKFIMVSTDKAVNPTNVMGACKRLAELYVQSLTGQSATRFITTRFGNVLGSQGSVVPFFKKQILQGQPVTVTHPDITRYFMTIPEACRLVLEACTMGKGGEIFVFDMGEPVKIVDLAKKMIRLAGYRPGIDLPIHFTGLRPGEKMYEELFKDSEELMLTHHPKIMSAKRSAPIHPDSFVSEIQQLIEVATEHRHHLVHSKIRNLLPEFQQQTVEITETTETAELVA